MMYMIMTDRFNNPIKEPNHQWNSDYNLRQGGNFEGIRQQLDYLQELGVGTIWISPILKNCEESYHGYGIEDFLEIDSCFASDPNKEGLAEEEFINLVDEAHARGMYVVLDIVLNHAGDIFGYHLDNSCSHEAEWSDSQYNTCMYENVNDSELNINPVELKNKEYFRKQGKQDGWEDWKKFGDFYSLKEFKTEYEDNYQDHPVWNILIKSYQYMIARTDIDGFRIDTIKHIESKFSRTFCNAIREFALSIGKKNFLIFGECNTEDEKVLAEYTGHNTFDNKDNLVGADAQLDFPLQRRLTNSIKNGHSVMEIKKMYDLRKSEQKHILSSHGEASRFFVTFLDNHDCKYERFNSSGDENQVTLGIGCLLTLIGIPCIYSGTEMGLTGVENPQGIPEDVREALWGKEKAFDKRNSLYKQIKKIANLRNNEPAIRYGRQYFREISGNGYDFGFSNDILAFSKILNDSEIIVIANMSNDYTFNGEINIDKRINYYEPDYLIVYSNMNSIGKVKVKTGKVNFYDENNQSIGEEWACRLCVSLRPSEIQIFGKIER